MLLVSYLRSLYFGSQVFFPVFSSESFIVLAPTVKVMIHFELIFVHGIRKDPT